MNTETPRMYDELIDVSIVFATCDRCSQLRETLDAYRKLDTQGIRWELVIVDNNSHDDTDNVLAQASADLPINKLFVADPGQNNARNAALSHLRGELVIFTDDDALPSPDCIKGYLAATERWPNDAIFGARIEPRFPPNTPAWIQSPDFTFSSTAFARYSPSDHESRVKRHPYGPSFAVRREALGNHQFPTHLGPREGAYAMGGEGHFLRRLAAEGWGYVYVPGARVEHVIRPEQVEPAWLIRRANKKGRGQVYMPSTKRPRRIFWRGVSLRLWFATLRAGIRFYALSPFVTSRVSTMLGIKFELRRGEIQERLSQRSNRKPPGPHGDGLRKQSSGAQSSTGHTRNPNQA